MFGKYPLDYDSLEVGTIITVADIEKHFSVKEGTDAYSFKLMSIQSAINQNTNFTAKITGGEIHVLTWEQASSYNDKSVNQSITKIKRHIQKNVQVLTDGFSPEMKQIHERRMMKGAFLLEALKESRKKLIQSDVPQAKQIGESNQ